MVKHCRFEKPKMLVITGIFFNAFGNQSMKNSILGYLEEYNVDLITAANLAHDNYISKEEGLSIHEDLRIKSIWPARLQRVLIGGLIERSVRAKKTNENISSVRKNTEELVNTSVSPRVKVVFNLRSALLAIWSVFFVTFRKVDVVCIYEINGMLAAKWLRKIFPDITIFGKFQGTALGGVLSKGDRSKADFETLAAAYYPLDHAEMQHAPELNGAIMTNDGTFGDQVLKLYGLDESNILFLPNGLDLRVLSKREEVLKCPVSVTGSIRSISVSRLTGWKRVPRVIKGVAAAHLCGRSILHRIIGGGSASEVEEVQKSIEESGATSAIRYLGPKDYEATIEEIAASDLLISIFSVTNACNPLYEALALCVPVVTIRDPRLEQVLGDRIEGCFLLEEKSDEPIDKTLADALLSIDAEEIQAKKLLLRQVKTPTWTERNIRELAFLNELKAKGSHVAQ